MIRAENTETYIELNKPASRVQSATNVEDLATAVAFHTIAAAALLTARELVASTGPSTTCGVGLEQVRPTRDGVDRPVRALLTKLVRGAM